MAKQIAKLLKADLNESGDLKAIAKMLQSKGRGGDTMLAHITKREAEILKAAGGAGTINPETGLPEFYEPDALDTWFSNYYSGSSAPATDTVPIASGSPAEVSSADISAADYQRQFGPTDTQYGAFGDEPLNLQYQRQFGPTETSYGAFGEPPTGVRTQPGGEAVSTVPSDLYSLVPSPRNLFANANVLPSPYSFSQKPDYNLVPPRSTPVLSTSTVSEPAKAEKSFFDKLSTDQLVRLGLTGALGLYGSQQAKKAAEQGRAGAEEQKALGVPYQTKGAELQRAAAAGELTPAGQQSLQALQARLAQGVESRGGVGAAQAAAQLEAYRQQLLQGQYDYGIKVSQIGDSIALGAIRTGMQADQQLNQANTAFYTNLAMIGAGIPMRTT